MPTESKHALLSASGAYRWLACTAAPHFEENFPDSTSSYAEEGTLAHSVCELYARKQFTALSTRKFNADLKKLRAQPLFQEEMLRTAEAYVEYLTEKAMSYAAAPHVALEVRVDLTDYIPDGFGTCDCAMIGGETLHITDYKHGKGVKVSAVENPQMRLYALGALKLYKPIFGDNIRKVSMGICQPRLTEEVSEEELTVEELLAWGESVKPKAREAFDGPGVFSPGEHCRFCRGRAQCRERAKFYSGFEDFVSRAIAGKTDGPTLAELIAKGEPILTNMDVGLLLKRADGIVAWYNDLQSYATGALLDGKEIPGYKLVEGRSNRTFIDVDRAFRALTGAGYEEAMLYDRKPKTLTEIEKLLGRKKFSELLSGYVIKPKGKPTLVPASDKRETYNSGAAEFENIK